MRRSPARNVDVASCVWVMAGMLVLPAEAFKPTNRTELFNAIEACKTASGHDDWTWPGTSCTASDGQAMADWDTSLVTDMDGLLRDKYAFNGDISRWNVGAVTTMEWTFYKANAFNGDISDWDVSQVTSMNRMFRNAPNFNQDLSKWNVGKVKDFGEMFSNCNAFNGDISKWDTRSAKSMLAMFAGADNFAADISNWDVSAVTSFKHMFMHCEQFLCDLTKWNSAGGDATSMFLAANKMIAAFKGLDACTGYSDPCINPKDLVAKECAYKVPAGMGAGNCTAASMSYGTTCYPLCSEGKFPDRHTRCALGPVVEHSTCTECPAGSYCPAGATAHVPCRVGSYCPAGRATEVKCGAGYYCETPSARTACPAGSYCPAGATSPTPCSDPSRCLEGSQVDPSNPPLKGSLQLTVDLQAFVSAGVRGTAYRAFVQAMSEWLGEGVVAENVTVSCVCVSSCELREGKTLSGDACGAGTASGRASRVLQAAEPVEIAFVVAMDSPSERKALESFAGDANNLGALKTELEQAGFPKDVASGATVSVDVVADTAGESNTAGEDTAGESGSAKKNTLDLTSVIITVLVAVPVALAVVGLAIYQNTKKPKPVPIGGLVFSIVFAFYDYFSDVWFAVMPTPDPQFQYFTWIAGAIVGVATLVGAGGVYYAMSNHELIAPAPGVVEYVLAFAAVTNMELLGLMPWVSDAAGGLPSATVAFMPTASVVVEDLPQLIVQGAYMVVSGDTQNYVVLVSLAMSSISLLLRFTRSAMAAALPSVVEDGEVDLTSDDEDAQLPERIAARKKRRQDREASTASHAMSDVLGI